jgi:hypothetical protein
MLSLLCVLPCSNKVIGCRYFANEYLANGPLPADEVLSCRYERTCCTTAAAVLNKHPCDDVTQVTWLQRAWGSSWLRPRWLSTLVSVAAGSNMRHA